VVNDADIGVPPHYLRTLVAELQNAGLVTCPYRASGATFAARFEALGIATDFVPSTLLAPLTGVREFGLGSTLAFRAHDLERVGSFSAIRDYVADDYQLGRRMSRLGLEVRMSRMTVETWLGDSSWSDVWQHQVRWARTIRLSRAAYFGLPVTFATLWAAAAAFAGLWQIAATLLVLRMAVAFSAGALLRDGMTARLWPLVPARDLFGVAVWLAGAFGSTVKWGDRRLRLSAGGRIAEISETPPRADRG
jgi:ceramide glucosyltransferase